MEKEEILVGQSNGLRHSVWEASSNMGCAVMQYFYSFWSVRVIWICIAAGH